MVRSSDTVAPIPVPEHMMVYFLATDQYLKIRACQLKALREVFIMVPLDCPEEIRNAEIDRIVGMWKVRRKNAGFDLNPRDRWTQTRQTLLHEMNEFPKKIKEWRNALKTVARPADESGGGKQLPHASPQDAPSSDIYGVLVNALKTSLQDEFPDYEFTDELLERAVERAVRIANRGMRIPPQDGATTGIAVEE